MEHDVNQDVSSHRDAFIQKTLEQGFDDALQAVRAGAEKVQIEKLYSRVAGERVFVGWVCTEHHEGEEGVNAVDEDELVNAALKVRLRWRQYQRMADGSIPANLLERQREMLTRSVRALCDLLAIEPLDDETS